MPLSTLAIDTSSEAGSGSGAGASTSTSALLRNLDLVLLAIALPVFLVADLPLVGYAVVAAAWVAQRVALRYAQARAQRSLAAGDRNDAFRTTAVSTLGRVWLVSFTVLGVGLVAGREDGLAAAILAAILFTVMFGSMALTEREQGRQG